MQTALVIQYYWDSEQWLSHCNMCHVLQQGFPWKFHEYIRETFCINPGPVSIILHLTTWSASHYSHTFQENSLITLQIMFVTNRQQTNWGRWQSNDIMVTNVLQCRFYWLDCSSVCCLPSCRSSSHRLTATECIIVKYSKHSLLW